MEITRRFSPECVLKLSMRMGRATFANRILKIASDKMLVDDGADIFDISIKPLSLVYQNIGRVLNGVNLCVIEPKEPLFFAPRAVFVRLVAVRRHSFNEPRNKAPKCES